MIAHGQGAARPGAGGGVEAAMAANAKVEELLLIAVVLREKGGERGEMKVSNDKPTPSGRG